LNPEGTDVLNQHDIDLDEAGQQFLRIVAKSFACGWLPWPGVLP